MEQTFCLLPGLQEAGDGTRKLMIVPLFAALLVKSLEAKSLVISTEIRMPV